jgi:hypothetical protein
MIGPVTNVFSFVADLTDARDWYSELLGGAPPEIQPQLASSPAGGSVS